MDLRHLCLSASVEEIPPRAIRCPYQDDCQLQIETGNRHFTVAKGLVSGAGGSELFHHFGKCSEKVTIEGLEPLGPCVP
jgi:hypothetical protein